MEQWRGTGWHHSVIRLLPTNPSYRPIVLEGIEEGEISVIAELVEVLVDRGTHNGPSSEHNGLAVPLSSELEAMAAELRSRKRAKPAEVERVLLALCFETAAHHRFCVFAAMEYLRRTTSDRPDAFEALLDWGAITKL